jgi:predicted adenylyl cyclase CyaB
MSNIELEYRALLTKEQYSSLLNKLNKSAKDLGEDDKNVYFFIFPDKLLKVVNNVSKNTAKIVLKLNKIGLGSDFEEIEIPIEPKNVEKSVHMFKSIGFNEVQESFQKRHNYLYKSVELAIKYSDNWGYHIELEILLDNKNKIEKANKKIFAVASELGLKILTDQELKDFTKKIDSAHREKKSFKR